MPAPPQHLVPETLPRTLLGQDRLLVLLGSLLIVKNTDSGARQPELKAWMQQPLSLIG